MRDETMKRSLGWAAVACGLWVCAAAHGQAPMTNSAGAATVEAASPVVSATAGAGKARLASSAPEGSPLAAMFFHMPSANFPATPVASPAEKDEEESKDGGIKVHGHWVVEVKRKDGTVKDRREFENSYNGGGLMGLILAGMRVPIDPAIVFQSSSNGAGSLCNGTVGNSCVILESSTIGHGSVDTNGPSPSCAQGGCYYDLATSLTSNGSGGYASWVLTATIAPTTGGTFDMVSTTLGYCQISVAVNSNTPAGPSTISPSYCYNNALAVYNAPTTSYYGNGNFTSTVLPGGAVTVTAGETLVFTVTISFS